MIYYHGTTQNAARCIEDEGFRGSELSDLTVGRHVDDGVVFLATTVDHAAGYGDAIIAVDTDHAIFFQECPVTGLPEYYVTLMDLEEDGSYYAYPI